jgi:hypothetical protein
MSVLRNIYSDLVEKKLWPVAAVLVLALIAVPLALSGGGNDAAPAAPAAGAAAADKPAPIKLDTSTPAAKVRKGGVRDPFKQLHVPKPPPIAKAMAPVPAATATPAAGGGAAGTPSGATPTTTPTTTPVPSGTGVRWFTSRVSLRFGRPDKLKSYRGVKRLTALPSSTFPFFIYMGVLEDGNTAVFAIAADVSATGDVKCRPSKVKCQLVELKPGDSVKFVYHPTDGRDPITYRLELSSVKQVDVTSAAKAAKARAAVNPKGSVALKALRAAKLLPQLNRYAYSSKTGLLRRVSGAKVAKATAARVPARVSVETPWGWIAKLNGGVFFSPGKAARG